MAGRFEGTNMPQWIPTKTLAQLSIILRSQLSHANVHARASPSFDTQTPAAVRVIVNGGANTIDVIESLKQEMNRAPSVRKRTRSIRRSHRSGDTYLLPQKAVIFLSQFQKPRHRFIYSSASNKEQQTNKLGPLLSSFVKTRRIDSLLAVRCDRSTLIDR
jgi:hypothetical protein